MSTVTIPVEYSKRSAVEQYCKANIGPRCYTLHNAIGGEHWTIKHSPSIEHSEHSSSGNWVLECNKHHALIVALKYARTHCVVSRSRPDLI